MKFSKALLIIIVSLMSVLIFHNDTIQAQSGVIWNSKFYNNAYLNGTPVVNRQDSEIAFNWGTGSPAAGVNADNFTARFTTSTYFDAATYRFNIVADDGVKLIIDDSTVIINTFDNPRPSQTLTADIQLSAGQHKVQLDYREVQGDALVFLGWNTLSSNNIGVIATAPSAAPVTNGWIAEYFANANLTGSPSAIYSVVSPSNNWGNGSPVSNIPVDNFSARWTGNLVLDGVYELSVRADDGVRVFVNGVSYINEWRGATGRTYTARFTVPRGTHTIVIEYYEALGSAFMEYSLNRTGDIPSATVLIPAGQTQTGNVAWTAQYYNNANLIGSPVVVQTEYSISRNWGSGSPIANMPADNFSIRWSSVQPLSAGTYRMTVRADDGVRVFVNGVNYINEWHANNAAGNYVATVVLPTGNHGFVVEYYEGLENALIDFSLTRTDNVVIISPSQPQTTSSNARITVTSTQLNVRQTPSIVGRILTQLTKDQTYPIVGRNVDSSWWQINVNGTVGWVNAFFTSASNIQNVPVTNTNTQVNPPATAYSVTTTANVNLRTGPGTTFGILSIIPDKTTVSILARNTDTTWWKVSYRGVVGWVNAGFVTQQANTNLSQIAISR